MLSEVHYSGGEWVTGFLKRAGQEVVMLGDGYEAGDLKRSLKRDMRRDRFGNGSGQEGIDCVLDIRIRSWNVRFKKESLHMHKDESRATETGTLWCS